jgi:hypothetical protein
MSNRFDAREAYRTCITDSFSDMDAIVPYVREWGTWRGDDTRLFGATRDGDLNAAISRAVEQDASESLRDGVRGGLLARLTPQRTVYSGKDATFSGRERRLETDGGELYLLFAHDRWPHLAYTPAGPLWRYENRTVSITGAPDLRRFLAPNVWEARIRTQLRDCLFLFAASGASQLSHRMERLP